MLNLKFVKFWYTDDTLKLNSANGISYVDRRKRVQIGPSLLTSAEEEGRTSPEQVVRPKKWKQPGQPVSLLCCVETPDGPSFKVRVPCKVREDRSGAWPTASARC